MSNIKNYTEQGGGRWVVNGTLEIGSEGQLRDNMPPTSAKSRET